jgi:hypothetical protein
MNGKCSLGAMNGNIQFIGLVMLSCIVVIVAIYYFRDVNNKHSKILEKYEVGDGETPIPEIPANQKSEITYENYGSLHNAGTSATDLPKYSNRRITSRECQVYFANENACDADNNKDKKCKYEFTDDWKEIKEISDPLNPSTLNFIPKKVYNQSYTRDDITNQNEMTACFKKVDNTNSNNANRFVYNKNSLVNYGYGGTGQLISLNVDGTEGNYISMHFNNDITPSTNYGHIIDSISSLKRSTIPGITTGKRFFRLKLDDYNRITHFERVTINSTQTGFDIDNTFDVTNMIASGTNGKEYVGGINGNTFRCFSITSKIPNSKVQIYRFNFNLLHNTPQVLSYSIHDAEVNIGGIINMDTLGQAPKEFNIAIPGPSGNLGDLIRTRLNDNTITYENYYKWRNPINSTEPKTDRLTYINIDLDLMKDKRFKELAKELEDEAKVPCDDYCDAQNELNKGVEEQTTYYIGKDDLLNLFTLDKGFAFYTSDVSQSGQKLPEDDNIVNQRQVQVDGDTIDIEPTLTNAGNIRPYAIRGTDYKYFAFTNDGTDQTSYTMNFAEPTICDILIVGGGGAGGVYIGGGGGGGGVLHMTDCVIPAGNHSIMVGKGGDSVNGNKFSSAINNGRSSKAFGIEVYGGGFGGLGQWGPIYGGYGEYGGATQNGNNGGSGGGGGSSYTGNPGTGGNKVLPNFSSSSITVNSYNYYGGNGATSMLYAGVGGWVGANGGGGAGGNAPANTLQDKGGHGADGVQINIDGNNYFWGGGGGGGQYLGVKGGNGGKGGGGGGNGAQAQTTSVGIGGKGGITKGQDGDRRGIGSPTAGNGGAHTGGGGGGTGRTAGEPNAVSGAGGSGIVIVRYKVIKRVTKKTITQQFMTTNYQDIFDRIARGNNYTYADSDNGNGFVKNSISTTEETNGIEQSIVYNDNIVKKYIITAFVFLEVGYYRFKYELITYEIGKKDLRIIIFENVNGVPDTTKKIELNSIGDTTFVSAGGFYKIAFCYTLYNDSKSTINYNFTFKGKHSSTTSFESTWDDMIKYLYKDIRLYNVLLNNIISTDDSFLSRNNLFRKDGGFNGYTSKLNPGYDVLEIIKEKYLHTVKDEFDRTKYGNLMNTHAATEKRLRAAYNPNIDSEIIYIDKVKKALNDFNCTAELGSRPTQLSLPKPATNFIISNVNYKLPLDYITYGGITEKNRRTPADMTDTNFYIIDNATKTIYIDESSFGQKI